MRNSFLIFLFLSGNYVFSQDTVKHHKIDREISIRYDNDIYFFSDKYYTSGLDISYARVLNPGSLINKLAFGSSSNNLKSVLRFHYGHKIFTPEKIVEMELENRDRPYAGWHYAGLAVNTFSKTSRANHYSVELGMVGPQSGIGRFQKWYHNATGIVAPEGWSSQIANEFVANLRYVRFQSLRIGEVMDIIIETDAQIGNGQSFGGAMGTVRFGRINSLNNSAYANGRLSAELPSLLLEDYTKDEEGFLFYGIKGQYIFNNIFIEGSMFNNNSPHQEEIENILITQQLGYMYSNYYTTVTVTVYMLSEEVVGGKRQTFASLALMIRF